MARLLNTLRLFGCAKWPSAKWRNMFRPLINKGGGGGFYLKKNLKKPNINMESHFVFFWVLLGIIGFLFDIFEDIFF